MLEEYPQLPASVEAEQHLLAAVIVDGELMSDVLDIVRPEDFYTARHRRIFEAATSLYNKSLEVEIISISEILSESGDDEMVYMSDLVVNAVTANPKSHAKIIKTHAVRRTLISAAIDISRHAYSTESHDIGEIVDFAQTAIMRIDDSQGDRLDLIHVNAAIKQTISDLDRRWKDGNKINGLASGLKAIDERVNGYKPGQFVVIAGRPGMAKSTLALQMCLAFASQDKNGIFFSLEMSVTELTEKALANIGKIPQALLQKPTDQFWNQYSHNLEFAARTLKDKKLNFVDCPGIHINQIKSYARKAHKKNKLDWLVIDHMHITTADGKSPVERYSMVSKELKRLAKELQIPVFALGQLNRGVESRQNKKPLMSDLRESGSIEEDADIIHLLYREDYYAEDPEDCDNAGLIEINTAKFRNGKRGTDLFQHYLSESRIEDTDRQLLKPVKTHYKRGDL
jgi:replicative DNA helicase